LAGINTTTTTTTTTEERSGTQLQVSTSNTTFNVGDVVTNVELNPYIANRIVSFFAYNMRANQRLHAFFDGVLVDEHCAPAVIPANGYISDTSDYKSLTKNGDWGTPLITNGSGQIAGQFNIPAGKFKTGDRLFELADVDSLTTGNDAFTTIAHSTFTASNLTTTKKAVTLTTVNPDIKYVPISNTKTSSTNTITTTAVRDVVNVNYSWEPLAQGLSITVPTDGSGVPLAAGIYATSIDLYFKQKPPVEDRGIQVYLTEINNGYPDGNAILPFSTTWLPKSAINTSNDASVATTFTFEAPVYMQNNKEYAVVIKPDQNDPDYFVWTARLGDNDVATNLQMFSQPVLGTAFYGATTTEWTAIQDEYVKFNLKRAVFSNATGTAVFNNANTEFFKVQGISYANSSVGIKAGDYVFSAANSAANTANTNLYGIMDAYEKGIIYMHNDTGNAFTNNSFVQIHRFANTTLSSTPNTTTLVASANLISVYNPIVDVLAADFAAITPPGTGISYRYTGTSNSYAVDSNPLNIKVGYETEFFDKERIVASKSNELNSMSGSKSMTLYADMRTDTDYLSPLIDTVRNKQKAIANDIDPVGYAYEEFFNSGGAKSKYISKVITLADGQDAEDLQVIMSAYRPPSSDILAYVRFLNAEDAEPISLKTWTPLVNKAPDLYSNPSNPADMREFVFIVPKYYGLKPTTGTITASNSSTTVTGTGTLFTSELKVGYYINMRANTTFGETTRKVVAIANDSSMTLDAAFNGNYTTNAYFLVPPPTTPYLSTSTSTQLSGNVAVYTNTNIITGTGTKFTTELRAGSTISVSNDQQVVVSIANDTILSVGTVWSSNASGVNAFAITPAGVTYLNSSNNQYTTYKRFQIKFVLQSDNSATVPRVDDIRALALQL
jgi:hypothetical protein